MRESACYLIGKLFACNTDYEGSEDFFVYRNNDSVFNEQCKFKSRGPCACDHWDGFECTNDAAREEACREAQAVIDEEWKRKENKMKTSREIREEKYPKLFNHLKTMQGITEEQREICLNDFYEMNEEGDDFFLLCGAR